MKNNPAQRHGSDSVNLALINSEERQEQQASVDVKETPFFAGDSIFPAFDAQHHTTNLLTEPTPRMGENTIEQEQVEETKEKSAAKLNNSEQKDDE